MKARRAGGPAGWPAGTLVIAGMAGLATWWPAARMFVVGERSGLLAGEAWRLWTAHLAHFSGGHWFWSALVWVVAGAWLEREDRSGWWWVVLAGAPWVTAVALWGDGGMARYGGLSGLACAPLVWGGVRLMRGDGRVSRGVGVALLMIVGWKVGSEWSEGHTLLASFPAEAGEVRSAVWAHLAGAVAGLAVAWRGARREGIKTGAGSSRDA